MKNKNLLFSVAAGKKAVKSSHGNSGEENFKKIILHKIHIHFINLGSESGYRGTRKRGDGPADGPGFKKD